MSYALRRGETYGMAGESGCGKTSSARALLGLLPSARVSGTLCFPPYERYDLADQGPWSQTFAPLRGRRIALTFQEPTTALDPLRRIGVQVAEVASVRLGAGRAAKRLALSEAHDVLARVGLDDLDRTFRLYPHEMSGGMRQRASLALALACRPEVLIADEPTTALDGILQARVLGTLQRVARESVGALEIITHDLAVLASMAGRIGVLYAGRLVEEATARDLVARPLHPYTRGLLAAVPALGPRAARPKAVPAADREKASRELAGVGCAFVTRCSERLDVCSHREPDLVEVARERRVACWGVSET